MQVSRRKAIGGMAAAAVTGAILPTISGTPAFGDEVRHHPKLQAALNAMRDARDFLKEAKGDFHGHRDRAIGAIEAAQKEVEECVE